MNTKRLIAIFAVLILITGSVLIGIKIFAKSGPGADYLPEDTVIMKVEGGDMPWSEYYGWLCCAKTQTELELGEDITDWTAEANYQQNLEEYVKDYAIYLITMYKGVDLNAAVLNIGLTEAELQELEAKAAALTDTEKYGIIQSYGSMDFYMYMSQLTALYTKCHDEYFGADGEKTDPEYIEDYVNQNGFAMFKGMFIEGGTEEEAADIVAGIEKADDKEAKITQLRNDYDVDDVYGSGYLVAASDASYGMEETLIDLEIGECGYAVTEEGVWIMLRCAIEDTSMPTYETGMTLREEASWSVYSSVVQGWSENVKLQSTAAYEKIDLAKVFK